MTLSRTLSWTFALGFIALSLGLASDSRAFTENHWMHRRVAQEFCVGGSCFWVDHTWAESLGDGSCSNDMVQSKNGFGDHNTYCYSHNAGNSACAGARQSYTAQGHWANGVGSCGSVWPLFGVCYANANNGVYGVNSVCHQASNRAYSEAPVPFVRNLGWIAGGWLSFGFYYDFGAWTPGGLSWGPAC